MAKASKKASAATTARARKPADATTAKKTRTQSRTPAPRPKLPPDGSPKLLSGGNPQIAKGDGDAFVQAYIAAMPGWKRDVGRRLDELVVRTIPDVRKAVRWNSPFWGVEGDGWFLAVHCITQYVKVTFFRGSQLEPIPPVGSKMKDVRYFHIYEGDWVKGGKVDESLLASWIRQAADLPGETCF